MKSSSLRIMLAALATLVVVATVTEAMDLNGPPQRPEVFRNPEELREYLKALNEYFAIVGRPRFGRSAAKRFFKRSPLDMDLNRDNQVTPEEVDYFRNYVLGFR